MALLSLAIHKGTKITIGEELLRVSEVSENGLEIKLEVGGRKFIVSDKERVLIAPQVFVSCGVRDGATVKWKDQFGMDSLPQSRLAFEAPLSIKINRVKKQKRQEV